MFILIVHIYTQNPGGSAPLAPTCGRPWCLHRRQIMSVSVLATLRLIHCF